MKDIEKLTDRYIEAEQFIINLKWWQMFTIKRKIRKFMFDRFLKYDF